jgi:hypothetical protein
MHDVTSTAASANELLSPAQRVLKGAWLGVLLGLLFEVLLLAIALWQNRLPDGVHIIADTVQKVSWSSLVCAALVAGQAAVRSGVAVAGVCGFLAAPMAFVIARALHRATLEILGSSADATSQWSSAGIKGIEYALLSFAIAWLSKRDAHWRPYVIAGAVVGATTYALTSLLSMPGDPLQRAVVEVAHPVGCALAVHLSSQVNARLSAVAVR